MSSADPQCANTIALSVLVVKVPGMVTLNGDAGAAKVPLNQLLPPQQLLSFTGCVPAVSVSAPRSTIIHIWYVTAVAPQLKVGLALHVPLKMVLNTLMVGLEPTWPPRLHPHVCPPDTVFEIVVLEGTMAETKRSITSLFCMPGGGVIDALAAFVASCCRGAERWDRCTATNGCGA